MLLALVAVLLVSVQCQVPVVPSLPNAFRANVVVTLPFIGIQKGVQYFDYVNQRNRVDVSAFGGTSITLELYSYPIEYDISIFGGSSQCTAKNLTSTLYPMSLPPFATFLRNETLGKQSVELWIAEFPGFNLYWWIDAVSDPKAAVAVKFIAEVQGFGNSTFVYSNYTIGPQSDAVFDYTRFGCPNPIPPVTYNVSGYAIDAVTGRPISGASILLGGNSATTATDGSWTVSGIESGVYTLNVSASGYFAVDKTVNVTSDIVAGTSADAFLSPVLPVGTVRIVLTWAAYPRDLDSHLLLGCCEVMYNHRACTCGNVTASLDRDATNGYGPETITIQYLGQPATSVVLQHFVFIYSPGTFVGSNAEVKVYNSNGLAAVLDVPTSGYDTGDRFWRTYNLVGYGALTTIDVVQPGHP